eukprot:4678078-Amphidinium_carterae.2
MHSKIKFISSMHDGHLLLAPLAESMPYSIGMQMQLHGFSEDARRNGGIAILNSLGSDPRNVPLHSERPQTQNGKRGKKH